MEDVCPYTCIIEDCSKPESLYSTRHAWMKHIREDHQQCWTCHFCAAPGKVPLLFPSIPRFLDHIRETHCDTTSEDQFSTLVSESQTPVPPGISRCPLCEETAPADSAVLLDHIAVHMHSFSLRSLPWPRNELDDAEDARVDYFKDNDYFADGSDGHSDKYSVDPGESSRDSDGLPSNLSFPEIPIDLISEMEPEIELPPFDQRGYKKEDCIEYMESSLPIPVLPVPLGAVGPRPDSPIALDSVYERLQTLFPPGYESPKQGWDLRQRDSHPEGSSRPAETSNTLSIFRGFLSRLRPGRDKK
jgi:hypothetical protein